MGMGMGMMSRGVVGLVMDRIELDSNGIRCDVNMNPAFYMSIATDNNVVDSTTSTVHLLIPVQRQSTSSDDGVVKATGQSDLQSQALQIWSQIPGVPIDVLLVALRVYASEAVRDSTWCDQPIVLV